MYHTHHEAFRKKYCAATCWYRVCGHLEFFLTFEPISFMQNCTGDILSNALCFSTFYKTWQYLLFLLCLSHSDHLFLPRLAQWRVWMAMAGSSYKCCFKEANVLTSWSIIHNQGWVAWDALFTIVHKLLICHQRQFCDICFPGYWQVLFQVITFITHSEAESKPYCLLSKNSQKKCWTWIVI